jgi:hypothetical protein
VTQPRSGAYRRFNKNKSSKPGGTRKANEPYRRRSSEGVLKNGLLGLLLALGAKAVAAKEGKARAKIRLKAKLKGTGAKATGT